MSFACYGPFHTTHLHLGFSSFPCLKKKIKRKHPLNHLYPPMQPQLHSVPQYIVSSTFPAPRPRSSKVQRIHTNEKAFFLFKTKKNPYCKMLNHSSEPKGLDEKHILQQYSDPQKWQDNRSYQI